MGKSFHVVLTKLVFTATVYHVWIERNVRKFQEKSCSVEVVAQIFFSMVRARLLSFQELPPSQAEWVVTEWNLSGH